MRARRRWLSRTRLALAAYDAADTAFGDAGTQAELEAALERREAARAVLGDAFAADTADRNDPETAKRVPYSLAGLRFIRRLVHRKP